MLSQESSHLLQTYPGLAQREESDQKKEMAAILEFLKQATLPIHITELFHNFGSVGLNEILALLVSQGKVVRYDNNYYAINREGLSIKDVLATIAASHPTGVCLDKLESIFPKLNLKAVLSRLIDADAITLVAGKRYVAKRRYL